jgi:hypothetical protein
MYIDEKPSIRRLINNIATQTRTRRSFTDNGDPLDDSNETVCMFWKFDKFELPRFTTPMISVYEENKDKREFKQCNKSYFLISTSRIRLAQPSEQA